MINLQWGTQKNGRIDTSLLVDVSGRGDYFEPTAAAQWRRMVAACAAATGVTLRPASGSSAYRPVAIQQQFYANYLKYGSPVAAVPGTSNHGWARAVDMTGYEGNTIWRSPRTGRTYAVNISVWNWLQAHAREYGYDWVTGDASGEAWHWESLTAPGTAIAGGSNAAPIEEDDLTPNESKQLNDVWAALQPGGLIHKTADALFKTDPVSGSTTGGNDMPGGVLRMLSIFNDLFFQGQTKDHPEGGLRYALRKISDKLGITKP